MKQNKYQYTDKCKEISGFGGGYEESCRTMVIAGMEWLDKHKKANPTFQQYSNIYGITANENKDMKAMQKFMNESIGNDSSGAMMQACTNHVLHAEKVGWDDYINQMEMKVNEDG